MEYVMFTMSAFLICIEDSENEKLKKRSLWRVNFAFGFFFYFCWNADFYKDKERDRDRSSIHLFTPKMAIIDRVE